MKEEHEELLADAAMKYLGSDNYQESPFGLIHVSPFTGAATTCMCARVLYWKDEGGYYKAVCRCGRMAWNLKDKPALPCPRQHIGLGCQDSECRFDHEEAVQ